MQRADKFCAAVALTMAAAVAGHYVRLPELAPIELEEWIGGVFGARGWNGSWVSDSGFIYKNLDGDVLKYDMRNGTSETFLSSDVLSKYPGSTITVSDDEAYVLIRYNVSSVFRHSTTALHTIYDMSNGQYYDIANSTPVQLVTFAPAGHGLTYVLDNNIYYLEDFAVDVSNPVAVTDVGEVGQVYCGVPDWVYEEEVLGSGSALWFSPAASHLAYAVFHDENVRNFSYFLYGEPGSPDALYPTEAEIKYPKVGTPNPFVTVFLYDIAERSTLEFQLPATIDNKVKNDYVLYDLAWVTETEVVMISTNRVQNESIVIRCTVDGICEEEVSYWEENGWLDPHIPRYSGDGAGRLEILPQPVEGDNYDHLVYSDFATGEKFPLTDGKRMIKTVYGWDEAAGLVFYSASVQNFSHQQHVYVVDTSTATSVCLSCDIVVDGDPCTYASATFSKSLSYYVLVCSGPNPHLVQLKNAKDPADGVVWEENLELRARLASRLRPRTKDLEVNVEGFVVRVRLLLPPTLDELSDRKYPAIVNVYGGPNSNQISDTFGVRFQDYIVTKREYIYIFIDGRGSGNDGWNRMFAMYRKFGTVEIEDQITVTRYLQLTLPYIDETRTGIWGWSYGGFASSWALAKDVDHVFNFALAVAPVTSFIYYDTIYTERYMGLPEDNEAGYNGTDLTRVVEAFRGRRYFIIHGNADDNVHYQNAMLMVKALEHADIDFRQQSYPDENHGLGGVYPHLYHTIDRYWARCFDMEKPPLVSWDLNELILV